MYKTRKNSLAQIINLQTEQQVFMALDIVSRSACCMSFSLIVTENMTELQ